MSGDLTAGRLPAGRSECWASLCADPASSALIRAAPSHSACPASGAQLDNCCVSAVSRASQRPASKSVFCNSSVALNTREWLKPATGAEAGSPESGHVTPSPALPQGTGDRAPSLNLGRVTEPAELLCFMGSSVCSLPIGGFKGLIEGESSLLGSVTTGRLGSGHFSVGPGDQLRPSHQGCPLDLAEPCHRTESACIPC